MNGQNAVTIPRCSDNCPAGEVVMEVTAEVAAALDSMSPDERDHYWKLMHDMMHMSASVIAMAVGVTQDDWREETMSMAEHYITTLFVKMRELVRTSKTMPLSTALRLAAYMKERRPVMPVDLAILSCNSLEDQELEAILQS